LYRSEQILQKWKECADRDVDIGVGGKDRKAAVVYCISVYAEFLNRKAEVKRNSFLNDPDNFQQAPVLFSTKEGRGKIRDLSGWVISEEIKGCISYINRYKCSKSGKVVKEVEDKRKMKAILDGLKASKDEVLDKSKYPETLEHITLYDRGGKTYVPDNVFDFFIEVSSLATQHFSEKNFHVYKQDAILVAHCKMQKNVSLQESFQSLVNAAITDKGADRSSSLDVDDNIDSAIDHQRFPKSMPSRLEPSAIAEGLKFG
jgi:hypothetical protein